nr:TniQ family protein [uncultured Comamonas sp.]
MRREITCNAPQSVQFPYQDEIMEGESGQGYVLRMSLLNGLRSVVTIKALLGKTHAMAFDAHDAQYIAHWFGASEQRLVFALEQIPLGKRSLGCSFAGHLLGRSYFLVRSFPRICPNCIEELGYCRLAWDLALCVACVRHRRVLIDACPWCTRPISWNRAAMNACSCGCLWVENGAADPPSSDELLIAHAIDLRVPDGSRDGGWCSLISPWNSWGVLLRHLSLDGVMRIVFALATAAAYDFTAPVEPRLRRAMPKIQQTIRMASGFGRKVAQLEPISLRTHRPSVLIDLLCDFVASPGEESSTDFSTAQSMLHWLLSNSPKSTLDSRHASLAQLTLF